MPDHLSDLPERSAALIAIDWGTSSFRAYRLNAAGSIIDRLSSNGGILSVQNGLFEDALVENIDSWMGKHGESVPILMSGMIGSRQGWVEADYIAPPASLVAVANNLTQVSGSMRGTVFIVPGISITAGPIPDVMRGEETQILGALHRHGLDQGTFVLPGTHSKWARVDAGAIVQFKSLMTGEVYSALCGHTILGAFMTARNGIDANGFRRGLDAGHAAGSPGALLHRIFGARTLPLFDLIAREAVADYLSGLLIGAEFAEAGGQCHGTLQIIGASELAKRYSVAADHFGLPANLIDPDCTALGLYAIAGQAGLLN